jgi:hypothetical protein
MFAYVLVIGDPRHTNMGKLSPQQVEKFKSNGNFLTSPGFPYESMLAYLPSFPISAVSLICYSFNTRNLGFDYFVYLNIIMRLNVVS